MQLRNKLLIFFTAIIIILAVIISLFFHQLFDFFLQEQDNSTLEIINSQILDQFENKKKELLRTTESIADYELFKKNLTVISSPLLNPLSAEKQFAYNQLDFFLNFFMEILDLNFIAVVNENGDFIYGKNDLTRSVMPEQNINDEVSLQISTNDIYIVSDKDIYLQTRKFRIISGYKIDKEFLDILSSDDNLPIFIFTENNYLLKNNNFDISLEYFSNDQYWNYNNQVFSAQKKSLYTGSGDDLYLGILHNKGLYNEVRREFQHTLWIVFSLTIIISIIIFSFFSKSITRPVDKLIKSIKMVSEGNYEKELNLKSNISEIEEVKYQYNKMLNKLDSSKKYINELINNLPVGILAYDYSGKISYYNNSFLEIFKLKAKEIEDKNIKDWSYAYKFIENEEKIAWELTLDNVNLEIDSFKFKINNTTERLHVIRDVSQNKKYQNYLLKTERQAAIGKVTAALAHEINNPLGIISNYLELIINKSSDDNLEYAASIKKELKRIKRLMKEMMQVARGKTELNIRKVDLTEWLEGWEDLISWQAAKKKITLDIYKNFDKEIYVFFDPDKMHQALLNLFLNSFEACNEGGNIKITINNDKNKFFMEIEDDGGGIDKEIEPYIFEAFVSSKSASEGSGLGLAVVKTIVTQHGGEIEYRVQKDNTIFTIIIPHKKINNSF